MPKNDSRSPVQFICPGCGASFRSAVYSICSGIIVHCRYCRLPFQVELSPWRPPTPRMANPPVSRLKKALGWISHIGDGEVSSTTSALVAAHPFSCGKQETTIGPALSVADGQASRRPLMPKNDQSRRIVETMKAIRALGDPRQLARAAWTVWIEQLISDGLSLSPEEWTGIIIERKQDAQE